VVGAALVAAWAGGTGVAQANGDNGTVPGCEDTTTPTTGSTPGTDPCQAQVYVSAAGDCDDPETLSFYIDVKGLEPGTEYTLALGSEDFTLPAGDDGPAFVYDFTTDAQGAATKVFDGSEDEDVQFPAGTFTLQFLVLDGEEDIAYGEFLVDDCDRTTPVTPPTSSTPTTTTPSTTAPAVEPAAPTTTAAATTTVAPVVVTAAAAAPAVLANTGAPVTAAALLGGGLLVAGAGALVATRRRAS
jgi:LPXTG-motif cell wall-anchored protein